MATITGSIDLLKFVGARRVSANGKKGVFIPLEENPAIYPGEKGVYAGVRVVERESTFGDRHYTHYIALSLSKKQREAFEAEGKSKDEINKLSPIIGNLEEYTPQASYESVHLMDENGDSNDLPFD